MPLFSSSSQLPAFSMRSLVGGILLCGLLLTLLVFGAVRHMELEKLDKSFEQEASLQIINLRIRLNEVLDQLRNARDIVMEAEGPQENAFSLIAQHLLSEQYFAQHIAFRRIVADADRAEYERQMQQRISGFRITEMAEGQHVPAAQRLTYHVIEHIEPAETGIFIRGLDAVSLDAEDDAISRAMSTGLPAATALYPPEEISLPLHENSITLILPVYRHHSSTDDPLHQFPPQLGEIALTLNAAALFRELIGISPLFHQRDISIEVFPGTEQNHSPAILTQGTVTASPDETTPFLSRLVHDQPKAWGQTLWLGGQPWHIVISRQPRLFIHGHGVSLSLLLGGLLLSALAAFWVYRSLRYTKHVEDLVAQRTAALERSNRLLRKHIGKRKALERELQENQERFRHMTRISADWHWETDAAHRFSMGMDKAGAYKDRMLGKRIWEISAIDPSSVDWETYRRKIASQQPVVDFEFRVRFPDDTDRWFSLNAEPYYDRSSRFCGYRGTSRDITARKKAEQALKKSEGSIRKLLIHQEKVREEERKRIAREIHDELGQYLLVMSYDVTAIRMGGTDQAGVHSRLLELSDKLDASATSLKRIINNLRPPVLDHGLQAAMEWQCSQFRKQHALPCHLLWDAKDEVMEEACSVTLFRIAQEALSNIARHAGASEVHIQVWEDETDVYLQVEDNGKGVSMEESKKPDSFGMLGMQERVKALGGHFSFLSMPGQGATLSVRLPLEKIRSRNLSAQEAEETEALMD